jgi:hypothetical protein
MVVPSVVLPVHPRQAVGDVTLIICGLRFGCGCRPDHTRRRPARRRSRAVQALSDTGSTAIRLLCWTFHDVLEVDIYHYSAARQSLILAEPLHKGDTQMWNVPCDLTEVAAGDHRITVRVTGAGGCMAADTITVAVEQSGNAQLPQRSFAPSGNSIGAYTEKGLLGNQTDAGGKGGHGKGAKRDRRPAGKDGPRQGSYRAGRVETSGVALGRCCLGRPGGLGMVMLALDPHRKIGTTWQTE